MGLTKGTTKSGGQKHALDKFYTKPEIALNLNLFQKFYKRTLL